MTTRSALVVLVILVQVCVSHGLGLAQSATTAPSHDAGSPARHASLLPSVDTGDTAWMLASSAMVLAMVVPGLALFYGGLVRKKNVLGTIIYSFIVLCLVSLIWVVFGYSLAFAPDIGGVIGGLNWTMLSGVGSQPSAIYGQTVPHQAFMIFQLLLAAVASALIAGAFAERLKFSALVLFSALWVVFIYCPLAHWIWGGGWLGKMGALDFAGGTVIHLSSGFGALACAVVLGRRRGYGTDYMAPHNLPLSLLGAGLLWFGWFGMNGGSARGANAVAVSAVLSTHIAAATAGLSWMTVEWAHRGKATALGVASGVVAGLAAITPASGYVGWEGALLIGASAGILCYYAIVWKGKIGYDDALDVVGMHGVGGIVGMLGTGLLASKSINPAGMDGLFFGNPAQFGAQVVAVLAASLFSFVGTYGILKLVDGMTGLRLSPEDEAVGLDLTQHNERAYS